MFLSSATKYELNFIVEREEILMVTLVSMHTVNIKFHGYVCGFKGSIESIEAQDRSFKILI